MAEIAPRIRVDTSELGALVGRMLGNVDLRGKLGKKIAGILRSDALRQFQAGGIPQWAPLRPLTVLRKASMGYPRLNRFGLVPQSLVQRGGFGPGNILERTGALLTSWTDEHDPHHVEEIQESAVSIGSDLEYAGTHQEGYTGMLFGNPKIIGTIPARPVRITSEATQKVAELLENDATKEAQ